jgi:hypothetical protein
MYAVQSGTPKIILKMTENTEKGENRKVHNVYEVHRNEIKSEE